MRPKLPGPIRTLHRRHGAEPKLNEDDAYDVLGLAPGADPDRVDAVHRRLASRAHPDRWLSAAVDEQEGVRARFEEVNEAYRVLKAARKAGLGASSGAGSAGRGRRPAPRPEPTPPPREPEPPTTDKVNGGGGQEYEVIEDDPVHKVPKGVMVAAVVVALVVAVVSAIGLASPSVDASRQRSVLGPLAYRVLEAERTGDHGTVWDLAETSFKNSFDRQAFVAHLDSCRRRFAPREVTRVVNLGGGIWEADWADSSGSPGSSYFRQQGSYRFGAILDDADLVALLVAPIDSAPEQPWCRQR